MQCPRCNKQMKWNSDYDCEDYGCTCGDGVMSFYECDKCNVEITLTTDCKGYKEEEE